MTQEEFELTRKFLKKYSLHFAETTAARLGYAVDDRFYGLDGEGHLARFRKHDGRAHARGRQRRHQAAPAVREPADRHRDGRRRGDARAARGGEPTPITYPTPKPAAILEEDRIIEAWPLNLAEERMTTIPVAEAFER